MRMTRSKWWWSWCLLILVSTARVLLHAEGEVLDPTFGDGGKVTTSFVAAGVSSDDAQDVVIQPDGKIVVVGSVTPFKRVPAMAVARYNEDGSLDETFGVMGRVVTQLALGGSRGTAVALQADGKIVVVGTVNKTASLQDFALVRFNPDGSLDTTFGVDGLASTDFGGTIDNAKDVVIDDQGRIVVVGGSPSARTIEVARYDANGALDKSFGHDGLVMSAVGVDAQAVTLQADGRIVIGGSAQNSLNGDMNFVVVRLEPDGSFDASFGVGGAITTDFAQGRDTVSTVLIQSDGRIIAGGTVSIKNSNASEFGLVRYLPDGTIDPTFGDGGLTITDLGSESEWVADGQLESDGRIVFFGSSQNDFAIVRYSADGVIDPMFGTDGVVRADFSTPTQPGTIDQARAGAIQADGKIVVVGTSIDAQKLTSDAALLRITAQ